MKDQILFDVALIGFNLDIWWTSSALKCTQRPHAIWCLRAQLRLDTPGPCLIIALDLACQALSLHKLSDEAQQRCDAYRFGILMSRCSVTWKISRNSMWIICELCLEMFGTNGCDGCIHVTWNISQIRLLQEIWPAKHTEIIWDPFLSIAGAERSAGGVQSRLFDAFWLWNITKTYRNWCRVMRCADTKGWSTAESKHWTKTGYNMIQHGCCMWKMIIVWISVNQAKYDAVWYSMTVAWR